MFLGILSGKSRFIDSIGRCSTFFIKKQNSYFFAERSISIELDKMQQVFMKSAVHTVARDGLEKVTTKSIAIESGLEETTVWVFE